MNNIYTIPIKSAEKTVPCQKTLNSNIIFHTIILVNQYIIILGTENLIKTDQQVHTSIFPLSSTLQAFQGRKGYTAKKVETMI